MKPYKNDEPDYGYNDYLNIYNKKFINVFAFMFCFFSILLLMTLQLHNISNFIVFCLIYLSAIGYVIEKLKINIRVSLIYASKKWKKKLDEIRSEKNPERLREITEKAEVDGYFELITAYLSNNNLPSDVIDTWLFNKAWRYGLRIDYIYGAPVDYNMRERILLLCVNHQNVSKNSLNKLTEQILAGEKWLKNGIPYFIEELYPEDDLNLIRDIIKNDKLDNSLKCRLKEYYDYRERLQMNYKNPNIDDNGFTIWRNIR